MRWTVATVAEVLVETPSARTLVLRVPGWPGHVAGQHVDVRLTAPDGYRAERSYSISTASVSAGSGQDRERIELTVQRVGGGEVSPYLTEVVEAGDQIELRGPIGGYFVWPPGERVRPRPPGRRTRKAPPSWGSRPEPPGWEQRATQLFAGGSGVVPLMAMIRERARVAGDGASPGPMRLVYSVREPEQVIYADELAKRAGDDELDVTLHYTRRAPGGSAAADRLDSVAVHGLTPPANEQPACYVCGPTGFVEAVAGVLVKLGHSPQSIWTERFG